MPLKNYLPLRRRQRPAPEPTADRNRTEWPLPGDKLAMWALWAALINRP